MATRPARSTPAASSRPSSRANAPLVGFVLHRYDWSESSLILDLFTREQGRIAVAAKGAKRPHSQLRSVLLPFQRLAVSVGRLALDASASEVQTLRGAEWAGGAAMPTGAALFNGFYLNELLMKLLARHDPHAVLFDIYAATLASLTRPEADDAAVESALRAFELSLLREIGVLPDLSLVTATQQPLQDEASYLLLADSGVVPARADDAGVPAPALVRVQAALVHGSLPALQGACAGNLPAWKTLLRGLVQSHLGNAHLRTRQVMIGLQSL